MRLLTSFAAVVGVVDAVIVTPESPCEAKCGNVLSSTSMDDFACTQDSFNQTSGEVFKDCVECEMNSRYGKDDQSDNQWMLYNLRYGVSYCLFGYPKDDKLTSTICETSEACGAYQDAIKYKNLTTKGVDAYDYCAMWPVSDDKHFSGCENCLRASGDYYLANFITVLQAGCVQQPEANVTIAFDGDVFSQDIVNVTDPSPQVSVDPAWFDQGPLNVGAKAGIVAGGIVLILILSGCCIVWRGKRRRKAFLRNYKPGKSDLGSRAKGWPSPIQVQGMKEVSDTPLSQKPLRSWDESPISTHSDQVFPKYFSPYASQYNSPVSASETPPNAFWPVNSAMPQQPTQNITKNIGVTLGGDYPQDLKGKGEAESYEMQNVASPEVHDDSHTSPSADQQSYFTHSRKYSGSYRNFSGRRDSAF